MLWLFFFFFFNCYLWEPKMCRLAWQLLGMLGNVLGLLGMLRNVLGMLATSSASSACFPQGPRSPTSKIKPPTCFLISCEAKGVVGGLQWGVHYSLGFTAYKEASGGFYLQCGTPRTLREACRGGRGRCKHA